MKRFIALFLAFLLSLSLFGCQKAEPEEKPSKETDSEDEEVAWVMKSENFTITSDMMTYYLNVLYQQYASTYAQMGLDTSKDLREQSFQDGVTWYDHFMSIAESNAKDILVLCEAAKAAGHEIDEIYTLEDYTAVDTLQNFDTYAKLYHITLEKYLETTFGRNVTKTTYLNAYDLSMFASYYSEILVGSYSFEREDMDNYYSENKSSFNKVDYLVYTFKADDRGISAETAREYADELLLSKSREEFEACVENYISESEASKCLKVGAMSSADSELNKWLFDEATEAYETRLFENENGKEFTVAMILPQEGSDLGDDCIYRDTYRLKNFRYIPFEKTYFRNDEEEAKSAAEDALASYKKNPTEENFAKICDEYDLSSLKGGLAENVDKGAIGDEIDAWLYDSARKNGDCQLITVPGRGSYVVYYVGDGDIKWENQAGSALISEKYTEDRASLESTHSVETNKSELEKIDVVSV